MIALFPMLVSNTVSRNIIPGVAKVLENYLMVYGITNIMRKARTDVKGAPDYSFKNKKLVRKESEDPLADFFYHEIVFEQSSIGSHTGSGNKGAFSLAGQDPQYYKDQRNDLQQQRDALIKQNDRASAKEKEKELRDLDFEEKKAKAKAKGGEAGKAKDASVGIGAFDMKSISLEPTWMKTDIVAKDGSKTSGIVGVKVVPYPVKSDAKLAHLLMYDRQVSNLQSIVIRRGRQVENFFYKAWKILWKIGTLGVGSGPAGGMAMTGDPKHDILARRTILKAKDASDIFVLVNQADLSDDFYSSANAILNLFRMGWSSIIIADDVNRRVSFCMRELKGMCSMMPYTMLYQTYSQAKVYEDLEDAKRSASSIFKVKRSKFSKIVGESIAQNKTEEFGMQNLPLFESEYVSEIEYLDENIGSFMKSLTPAKVKALVSNLLKGNTKGIPNVDPEKLLKVAVKSNPNFKKSYMLAKKVLSNSSPEIKNNKIVDLAAIGIASKSTVEVTKDVSKDIVVSTKEGIKRFIKNYRKNRDSAKGTAVEMPDSHYAEATFGWVAILGTLSVVVVAYSKLLLPYLKANLPGAIQHLSQVTLPNMKASIGDFFEGSGEVGKAIKDWDIATAPPQEIGLFVILGLLASAALLRLIMPPRR